MTFDNSVVFLSRLALVMLFLPFSALDKVLNFRAATGQARQAVSSPVLAGGMIVLGLTVEVLTSLALVTGTADRLGALVLAGYCAVTAFLFKRFWSKPDFRLRGPSQGRDVFWDFLKNVALAGALVSIALGPGTNGALGLLADPLSSTAPYATRGP
ncbi:MAG: DoxX family membrane protein [Acetobacteraceae bacterium]|nr:MAG: DoxX family membrane protein [Acetobacteraceae bacterium]